MYINIQLGKYTKI